MYKNEKTRLRTIIVVIAALGCWSATLSGTLASLALAAGHVPSNASISA